MHHLSRVRTIRSTPRAALARIGAPVVILALCAAMACDSATAPGSSSRAALVTPVDESGLVGTAGGTLDSAIVVQVSDVAGSAVPGAKVVFTAELGHFAADTVLTDEEGRASATYEPGTTAGTDTVRATVQGAEAPAVFFVNIHASAPVALAVVAGDNQSGAAGVALPDSLSVHVVDAYGNGVSGIAITWTPSGSSTISGADATTGDHGIARATLTPGAGAQTVTVHADAAGLTDVTFNASGT